MGVERVGEFRTDNSSSIWKYNSKAGVNKLMIC